MKFICAFVLVVSFAFAGYWSLTVAWADYQFSRQTQVSVQRATEITPGRAEYWAALSAFLGDEHPRKSKAALERANALNPSNSRYWIDLGLRAESRGDFSEAERLLLKAAEADRMYLPRWTLANFYFRRANREQFWNWARQATEMAYGSPAGLFSLCWQMTQDGAEIQRNLDIRRPEIQVQYLSFLLGEQHPEAIAAAALHTENRPLVLAACDRLLKERRVDDALQVWSKLHPAAAGPQLVTNGDFTSVPTSAGFDWRIAEYDGVSVTHDNTRPALRISFSGSQREDCEPLGQYVAVNPGTGYALQTRSETAGITGESGLRWRVIDAADGRLLAETASPDLRFATPPDCRLIRLVFSYRRTIGTRRIEGTVILRGVSISRLGG